MNRLPFWPIPVLAVAFAFAYAAHAVPYTDNGERKDANGFVTVSPYPVNATPITAASGNVAAAAATATLAGVAGKTTYITGFRCGGGGATAASLVAITVTGLVSSTQTYTIGPVAGVTLITQPVERRYEPPVPASAANTAIVVSMASLGAGNTRADCNAEGFQL